MALHQKTTIKEDTGLRAVFLLIDVLEMNQKFHYLILMHHFGLDLEILTIFTSWLQLLVYPLFPF